MKCWDCKKTVWHWQSRGIDNKSHRVCHRQRVKDLIQKASDNDDHSLMFALIREQREIESFY